MIRATACMKQLQDKTKRFLTDNNMLEEKQRKIVILFLTAKAYYEYCNLEMQSAKSIIIEALQQQKKGKVDKIGIARTLLLKAMITQQLHQQQQTLQAIKSAICYLQLKRISKFNLSQQFTKLGEILILQLHIAVNKLEILKYQQATMIYMKGLKIAQNTLGSQHKLTKLMKDIKKNRKATQKLLKSLSKQKVSSARNSQKFRMKKNRNHLRIKTEVSEGNSIDSKKYCKDIQILPKRKKGFQLHNRSLDDNITKDYSLDDARQKGKSQANMFIESKDKSINVKQQKMHINIQKLTNYPSKIIQVEENTPVNKLQIGEPKNQMVQISTNSRRAGKLINQRQLLQKTFDRNKLKSECLPNKIQNDQVASIPQKISSRHRIQSQEQQKSYCSLI